MATLFLSYQHEDAKLARDLELRLVAKGHSFQFSAGNKVHGDWRRKLQKALAASDAVIFLLSENGLGSRYVLGQIGSARAYADLNKQLILPVLVENQDIPDFIKDIDCYILSEHREMDHLAEELHQAIVDVAREVLESPRIFVSHRHKDESLAAALVGLLEASFHIEKSDIRCTSVQPYALSPGERVSERLRTDLNGCELVIGLIGPETDESRYVLFELGAAWVRNIPTFPVLVRGATAQDVPGPLGERHSVSLENEDNCQQLIDDIAQEISLQRRSGVAGRITAEARKLAKLASNHKIRNSTKTSALKPKGVSPSEEVQRMAKHITNYLTANDYTMVSFERIRENINPAYTDAAILELIDKSPDRFRRAKLKGGRPGIALIA